MNLQKTEKYFSGRLTDEVLITESGACLRFALNHKTTHNEITKMSTRRSN